jgi:hypothetical protein
MSDQRDQLPNDGSESVDEDMLFVVEDADDSSPRPSRASSASRATAKPKERTTSTRLPTGESRVIVGSKKPHNPLYGKIAKHGLWAMGIAILCVLTPPAVTWLQSRHWTSLVHKIETVAQAPQPAQTPESDPGIDESNGDSQPLLGDATPAPQSEAATLMQETTAATTPAVEQPSIDEYLAKLDPQELENIEKNKEPEGDAQGTTQDDAKRPEREDTIIELKNGSQFRGLLKKMTDDQITLSYAKGQYTFTRAEVSHIIPPGSREYQPYSAFPEAMVRLKRGGSFRAHVLKDSSDRVVLGYAAGKLTFTRAEVADIKYVVPDEAPFSATLPHFEVPAPPPEDAEEDRPAEDDASAAVPDENGSGSAEAPGEGG